METIMQIKEQNIELHLYRSKRHTGIKHIEELDGLAKKVAIMFIDCRSYYKIERYRFNK